MTFNFNKKGQIQQFFSKLFEIKTTLYLCHLRQYDEKLASHLALGEASEGLDDLTDRFIELYFGLYGTFDFTSPQCSPTKDPLMYTSEANEYIKTSRSVFSDSSLLQILDDVQEVLGTLMYKLKFVK